MPKKNAWCATGSWRMLPFILVIPSSKYGPFQEQMEFCTYRPVSHQTLWFLWCQHKPVTDCPKEYSLMALPKTSVGLTKAFLVLGRPRNAGTHANLYAVVKMVLRMAKTAYGFLKTAFGSSKTVSGPDMSLPYLPPHGNCHLLCRPELSPMPPATGVTRNGFWDYLHEFWRQGTHNGL